MMTVRGVEDGSRSVAPRPTENPSHLLGRPACGRMLDDGEVGRPGDEDVAAAEHRGGTSSIAGGDVPRLGS